MDSVTPVRTEEEGFSWLFAEPVQLTGEQLSRVNQLAATDRDALAQWFRERGGVDPRATHAKIALRGNAVKPVRIMEMRALSKCKAPLTGALALSPPAGEDPTVKVGFDLDQPNPHARIIDESDAWGGPYFTEKTIVLAPDESIVLHIVGATESRYCEFRIEARLLSDGKERTQVIDHNGQPFRVSSYAPKSQPYSGTGLSVYQKLYVGGIASPPRGQWKQVDPATWRFPTSWPGSTS